MPKRMKRRYRSATPLLELSEVASLAKLNEDELHYLVVTRNFPQPNTITIIRDVWQFDPVMKHLDDLKKYGPTPRYLKALEEANGDLI